MFELLRNGLSGTDGGIIYKLEIYCWDFKNEQKQEDECNVHGVNLKM